MANARKSMTVSGSVPAPARRPCTRRLDLLAAAACYALAPSILPAQTTVASGDDLSRLSLQELSNLEVTSVSKAPEGLHRATASIYVITHEDILRSGATRLMEALRLAPNLLVTQTSATGYTVAARGLGGNPMAQNFSNKLLMLIDGRSVYSPLYSGIYSDAQDVQLEDVDRIEVISGPGATLWGANAMNGVINVITRPSYLTQGTVLDAAAGNQEEDLNARYGGRLDGDLSYRVYGLAFRRAAEDMAGGGSAHDGWNKAQGGFRTDWSTDRDSATLQGDVYRAAEQQPGSTDGSIAGGNVLTRYQHHTERSEFQVQVYADQTERFGGGSTGGAFVLHTYDLQIQQSIEAGSLQRIVFGAGERLNEFAITSLTDLLFEPERRNLTQADGFIQDTLSLSPDVTLVAGIKMEDDPYWGWTPLPDGRLSWQLNQRTSVWAAASKAIRSPTPFDDDVIEKTMAGAVALTGNRLFRPETVLAYESGTRVEVSPSLSTSVALFYNDYDDLRTIEIVPGTIQPIFFWGNAMKGDTYGAEAWASWQVTDWWRLASGFTALREHFTFKPGASGIAGIAQAADDPSSHADVSSSMQLNHKLTLDATFRYVGALPNPALPHYVELNGRLGWRATDSVDLSIDGLNLLHARHYELPPLPDVGGEAIGRSVMAEARWKF